MCNLADALMRVLESFFNRENPQYPTHAIIIDRIKEKYEHFRERPLNERVERRIHILIECGILEYGKLIGEYAPGPRWEGMPVDQLEEE